MFSNNLLDINNTMEKLIADVDNLKKTLVIISKANEELINENIKLKETVKNLNEEKEKLEFEKNLSNMFLDEYTIKEKKITTDNIRLKHLINFYEGINTKSKKSSTSI